MRPRRCWRARSNLSGRVVRDGAVDAGRLDEEQIAAHGLAWMATYVAALRQLRGWAMRLEDAGECGEAQRLILAVGFGGTNPFSALVIPMNESGSGDLDDEPAASLH